MLLEQLLGVIEAHVLDPFVVFAFIRDSFREMLESVSANGHTFEECKEILCKSTYLASVPNIIFNRSLLDFPFDDRSIYNDLLNIQT